MTRSWAGPLGTGSAALAPFWLTADPTTSPQMRSPSASASLSRLRTSTPQPSLRTKPSAAASKALQRPVAESMPMSLWNRTIGSDSVTLTPLASAMSTSSRCKAAAAWWMAASDDAHAVSIGIAGPSRPRTKATRPAVMLPAVPKKRSSCPLAAITSRYSLPPTPTYTPVRLPRSPSGSMPASSRACQVVSSSIRCCGSIMRASMGDMRKKELSNRSMPSTKPPRR